MSALLDLPLVLLGALLLIPSTVFFLECLLAALPLGLDAAGAERKRPRFAVLMPAHDEAGGVGATITALLPELVPGDRILTVADNCSDDTAAVARAAGAEVVERSDPQRRGKGYALAFGMEHLAKDPPEVVIIFDADCRITPGGLSAIAQEALATQRPVQADYLLLPPGKPDAKSVVSGLALLVRNRVRPIGLFRVGMPCHLMGSGMAFPFEVLQKAPATGANLVEDLVMGIELALLGHSPLFHPSVRVTSELPDQSKAAVGQRRRWEHGTLTTLKSHVPRLVLAGLRRGRPDLLAIGLDLAVPPLALLVMLILAAMGAGALGWLLGASFQGLRLATTALGLVGTGVGLAWVVYGRQTIPLRYLLAVPIYVLWKIPLYLSLLLRGKQKTWERTARATETEKKP